MSDRLRSYDVARKTFSFLEFIGWSVVVIGIIAGFILAGSAGRYATDGQKFLLFLMGASSSLIGLFMVGAVQNWRAGVDSAEYGQQALKVAREQLEISRQGLKRQQADSQSFAALKPSTEQQPTASFEQQPTVAPKSQMPGSGEHRGEKIIEVYGSYRALGTVFPNYDEAVSAIDRKLDNPTIENKQEMPSSILLGPEPTTASEKQPIPVDQPSADGEASAPRSYAEAETPVKPNGPDVAIETSRDLADEEVAEEMAEETPAKSTDPATVATEEDPASKIKEEGGKFLYGRMEFSSREAAEKYVRQLGVNPNFRS